MIYIILLLKIEKKKNNADDKYDNNENDYINFDDINPNHYISIKPRETLLR